MIVLIIEICVNKLLFRLTATIFSIACIDLDPRMIMSIAEPLTHNNITLIKAEFQLSTRDPVVVRLSPKQLQ